MQAVVVKMSVVLKVFEVVKMVVTMAAVVG